MDSNTSLTANSAESTPVPLKNTRYSICGRKTEIWSRVCGYHRPVKDWNKGKQEEFKDRKTYGTGNESGTVMKIGI